MKIKTPIGNVFIRGRICLLPTSELVFINKKRGTFRTKKFKDLTEKQFTALFSFCGDRYSRLKNSFVGVLLNKKATVNQ